MEQGTCQNPVRFMKNRRSTVGDEAGEEAVGGTKGGVEPLTLDWIGLKADHSCPSRVDHWLIRWSLAERGPDIDDTDQGNVS